MKEFKVIIPDEEYSLINFKGEELPGVAVINSALIEFEPKEVFSWHLSIILECNDIVDNGMPSREEEEIVYNYGILLDKLIKGSNPTQPNALFLARITWNRTRQLIWRVFDPEISNADLQKIISEKSHVRDFEYRMEHDQDWALAHWYLHSWR